MKHLDNRTWNRSQTFHWLLPRSQSIAPGKAIAHNRDPSNLYGHCPIKCKPGGIATVQSCHKGHKSPFPITHYRWKPIIKCNDYMDMYTDTNNQKGQCSVTSIKTAIIELPLHTATLRLQLCLVSRKFTQHPDVQFQPESRKTRSGRCVIEWQTTVSDPKAEEMTSNAWPKIKKLK